MNKNNAVEIVFWWTMFVSAFAVCSFIFSLIAINFQNNYVEECVSSHVEYEFANFDNVTILEDGKVTVNVWRKEVCDKVMLVRNVSEVK